MPCLVKVSVQHSDKLSYIMTRIKSFSSVHFRTALTFCPSVWPWLQIASVCKVALKHQCIIFPNYCQLSCWLKSCRFVNNQPIQWFKCKTRIIVFHLFFQPMMNAWCASVWSSVSSSHLLVPDLRLVVSTRRCVSSVRCVFSHAEGFFHSAAHFSNSTEQHRGGSTLDMLNALL